MPDILVIDDDRRVRDAMAELLRIAGHRVDTAASGEDGLSLFAGRRYDVVVTDVRMPGIDGWEAARAVRRSRPDVGVVVISGVIGTGEPVPDVADLGDITLLAKPSRLEDVEAAIERAVLAAATRARAA